ncbi:hypothetical protein [Pelosinus baikalensis]|uniref:Uncharacterized protein n=1 Tax=Pelosinus baikalensis TaxID=2892015 RepID=A0ABS8HKP9_9FIRM|nr:hypothetical protein [Pelosinus baikalensis]MCC5463745.1 hypothetical protein [Pelosinus baikalensis]
MVLHIFSDREETGHNGNTRHDVNWNYCRLLAIGSYIFIPVGVMPIPLQMVFVLLSGVIFGTRLGVISVIV